MAGRLLALIAGADPAYRPAVAWCGSPGSQQGGAVLQVGVHQVHGPVEVPHAAPGCCRSPAGLRWSMKASKCWALVTLQ